MFVGVAAFIVVTGLIVSGSNSGQLNFKLPTSPRGSGQVASLSAPDKKVVINGTEITVDVADKPKTRSKGLSGVESLGENQGMLFVFDAQDTRPIFWMKGMLIPIDIIWIDDNKIVQIDTARAPQGDETGEEIRISPDKPIDYVLEVASGYAEANEIKVGDTVDLTQAL